MTKVNLAEMRNSIDWADRQIDALQVELRKFGEGGNLSWSSAPYPNSRATMHFVKAAPSSIAFIARDVSAIIAAQRDSLDHLVTALAEANGADDPSGTFFPFADSAAEFEKKHILRGIRHLPEEYQQTVQDTRPYIGGNDKLYALHWLNKNAKHRRPVLLGQVPGLAGIHPVQGGRGANIRRVLMNNIVDIEMGREPALIVDMTGDATFSIRLTVSFGNVLGATGVLLIPTLREFSNICRSIFDRFE